MYGLKGKNNTIFNTNSVKLCFLFTNTKFLNSHARGMIVGQT